MLPSFEDRRSERLDVDVTFGAPSTSGWHSRPGVVLVVVPAGIPNSGLRINQDNPGCSVQ